MRALSVMIAITGALICILPRSVNAGEAKRFHYEAVNAYPYAPLTQCIPEARALRSKLITPINGLARFESTSNLEDFAVWGSDFTDPGRASPGNDSTWFDKTSSGVHAGIELFSGHGDCSDQTSQICASFIPCNSPPAGAQLPGLCLHAYPSFSYCTYDMPSSKGVQAFSDWSNPINFGYDFVTYRDRIALGDGPSTNGWAGVGTDGGDNFVIIDNSCGIRPGFHDQNAKSMFAGVRNMAFIEITYGDAADVMDRGPVFGDHYLSSPDTGKIAWAWADTLSSVTGGSSCPLGGGFHGILGCGAHVTLTYDATCPYAVWNRDQETWTTVRNDAYDASGNQCTTYVFQCNWDCFTYPAII